MISTCAATISGIELLIGHSVRSSISTASTKMPSPIATPGMVSGASSSAMTASRPRNRYRERPMPAGTPISRLRQVARRLRLGR